MRSIAAAKWGDAMSANCTSDSVFSVDIVRLINVCIRLLLLLLLLLLLTAVPIERGLPPVMGKS